MRNNDAVEFWDLALESNTKVVKYHKIMNCRTGQFLIDAVMFYPPGRSKPVFYEYDESEIWVSVVPPGSVGGRTRNLVCD